MKVLPDKKLLLVGYIIAFIINIGEFGQVNGLPKLIGWLLIDNVIIAILVIVLLRIVIWISKKVGLAK